MDSPNASQKRKAPQNPVLSVESSKLHLPTRKPATDVIEHCFEGHGYPTSETVLTGISTGFRMSAPAFGSRPKWKVKQTSLLLPTEFTSRLKTRQGSSLSITIYDDRPNWRLRNIIPAAVGLGFPGQRRSGSWSYLGEIVLVAVPRNRSK